jgi:ribonuclease Z
MLTVAAHEADLLVHESTFAEEELERAVQTGHSTARQAAQIACDADVRLLALTHISTRYAGKDLREEARAVFPATEAPRDFDAIDIPFPEKGPAQLIQWSRRRAPVEALAEGESSTADKDNWAEDPRQAEPSAESDQQVRSVAPR